jgi:transcriptional antiterminator
MTWGGSLNRNGSDYIRKLKEVEKVLQFLESFKKSVKEEEEKKKVIEVIEIITNHFKKIFESE